MIYLTTGANGAGKTLLMLRDVRDQQVKENRPVFYNGFEALDPILVEFGWKRFDPKKWQDLPDGSICVMDEAQNEFPLRKSGAEVPDYINAIAQFRRKRGFDFWMTCPHPMLLDVFIRRLIDNPSWHRHIKRTAGAHLVSVLKWNAVNTNCEKPGSGESGEVSMRPFPKEVFTWYKSASLHTAKTKIPRSVFVLLACVLVVPVLGYFAAKRIANPAPSLAKQAEAAQAAQRAHVGPVTAAGGAVRAVGGLTTSEYVAALQPRIKGLPYTAAAYDHITQPQQAPYPAACIERIKQQECHCYTQQGTKLTTPADLCKQIVRNGFFIDWQQPGQRQGVEPASPERQAAAVPPTGAGVINGGVAAAAGRPGTVSTTGGQIAQQ